MSSRGTVARAAARPRTLGYVAALVVVAPFLAETVASANTPAVLLPLVLPLFAVVYGAPALLLRELWVRGRLTAPRLLAFGLAYTAFNEGVVAATWFKLAPGTARVLAFSAAQAGHVAGVNWAVAANLVLFHTAYSLVVPVVVVEALAAARRSPLARRPWIGRRGVVVCLVLVGLVLIGSLTPSATAQTCAGPASTGCGIGRLGAAAIVVVVGALLLASPPRERTGAPRPVRRAGRDAPGGGRPTPGLVLVLGGLSFGLAFFGSDFGLPLMGLPWAAVATALLLLAVVGLLATGWCRPLRRADRADLLLATGALLPGMLAAMVAWRVGQPVAVLLAVVLLVWVLRRLPAVPSAGSGPPPPQSPAPWSPPPPPRSWGTPPPPSWGPSPPPSWGPPPSSGPPPPPPPGAPPRPHQWLPSRWPPHPQPHPPAAGGGPPAAWPRQPGPAGRGWRPEDGDPRGPAGR